MNWTKHFFNKQGALTSFKDAPTRELDLAGIKQFLSCRATIEPRTFFLGTHKIISPPTNNLPSSFKEMLLAQKPKGPFALFLSGGVDSSILAKLYDSPDVVYIFVQTPRSKEGEHFRAVGKSLKGEKRIVTLTPETYYQYAKLIYEQIDEPVGDGGIIGVYAAAREAQKIGLKVAVIGEGADEAFGGYWGYEKFDKETQNKTDPPTVNWETVKFHSAAGFGKLPLELECKWRFVESEFVRRDDVPQDFVRVAMSWDRYKSLPNVFLWKDIHGCALAGIKAVLPFAHPEVNRFADTLPRSALVGFNWPRIRLKVFLKKVALEMGLPEESMLRTKSGFAASPAGLAENQMRKDIQTLWPGPLGLIDLFTLWSLSRWCKNNKINLSPRMLKEILK